MANVWPAAFTVQGRCTVAGEPIQRNRGASDVHVRVSDDGAFYEMYFTGSTPLIGGATFPAQVGYTQCPVAGDLLNDWTDPIDPATGYMDDPSISAILSTDNEDGVDTPYAIVHPSYGTAGALMVAYEARPGYRDEYIALNGLTPGVGGRISQIKVALDVQRRPGTTRRLCQRTGRTVLKPTSWFSQPYMLGGEWRGGVLEPSYIHDPGIGVWVFHGGLTETQPGNGQGILRLGRALSPDGVQPAQMNPVDPVWDNPSGWARIEGFHFGVMRNPADPSLFDLLLIGAGGQIYHYQSEDKGLNWTDNPGNPILRWTDTGFPTGLEATTILGGPHWLLSHDGTEIMLFTNLRPSGSIGGADSGTYYATSPIS